MPILINNIVHHGLNFAFLFAGLCIFFPRQNLQTFFGEHLAFFLFLGGGSSQALLLADNAGSQIDGLIVLCGKAGRSLIENIVVIVIFGILGESILRIRFNLFG